MIVQVTATAVAGGAGRKYLSIANAVFVIPFLIFAGPAGQIADRFRRTRVLQFTKLFEIPVMIFGIFALVNHSIDMLLVVLVCLAAQGQLLQPRQNMESARDHRR